MTETQTPEPNGEEAGPSEPIAPRRRPPRVLFILPVLLGMVTGLAALRFLPALSQDVGPAVVSASAGIGPARTILRIPLLGSISAQTHSAPLEVVLGIDEIDPKAVEQALQSDASRRALAARLRSGLGAAARNLAIRSITGAGILGGLAALLLPHRRLWWAGAGAAGGLAAAGALFSLTGSQYNVQAFAEPRFQGPVERAPQIIEAVQRGAGSIKDLKSRFSAGADRLSQILALASRPVDNPNRGSVAILHISDIHSNPLGLELARELARNFRVDAILDTGDLTSFGQPIEGRIAQLIPSMPAPYLVVAGNHDSDANRIALTQTPNASLLHDTVAEIKGVRIMGWADPAFTAVDGISQAEADKLQLSEAPRVAARLAAHSPDVLAVHSRLLASDSIGKVPLILAGHRHKQDSLEEEDTLLLEVGSTGATGLGSFLVEAEHAYEAQIIYFRKSRAVALDYIRLSAFGADFEVQRQTLTREPAP